MAGVTSSNRKKRKSEKSGVIRNDEVVTLTEFKDRMRMSDWAWRSARREAEKLGISLCVFQGNNAYISGQVWHAYLLEKSSQARKAVVG